MLKVMRYSVSHPLLRNLIKFFWVMESESAISISHKLLPVNNIDFIFNLSSPIEYITDEDKVRSSRFHFNGIRDKYYMINQKGKLRVFGASFYPVGLYPILGIPLNEFRSKTIELDEIINNFSDHIVNKISLLQSNTEIIKMIETVLVELVDPSLIPNQDVYDLIRTFNTSIYNINDFSKQYGINQRKLERIFNKYIGVSPKLFQRINRFNNVINYAKKNDNFTLLSYDNNYFDQNHFIKDFKTFTGSTPTDFFSHNDSIKQIMQLD